MIIDEILMAGKHSYINIKNINFWCQKFQIFRGGRGQKLQFQSQEQDSIFFMIISDRTLKDFSI